MPEQAGFRSMPENRGQRAASDDVNITKICYSKQYYEDHCESISSQTLPGFFRGKWQPGA